MLLNYIHRFRVHAKYYISSEHNFNLLPTTSLQNTQPYMYIIIMNFHCNKKILNLHSHCRSVNLSPFSQITTHIHVLRSLFQTFQPSKNPNSATIQMKAFEQNFPVGLLIMLSKIILSFKSMFVYIVADYLTFCHRAS